MQDIKYNDITSDRWNGMEFKGGLTENYVYNHLINNEILPFYWISKSSYYEMEFVCRLNDDIVPIEVKSEDNVQSSSLKYYVKTFSPKYSIRVSTKNFGFENNIKSVPLYAVFCIK